MNILLGLFFMTICLLLQSVLLIVAIRYCAKREVSLHHSSFSKNIMVVNSVMIIMVMGNLMQIAIWAGLFIFLGEFQSFNEAFYHSAVNFSTLGYGDLVMTEKYRVLGPLEAVNGVLMFGISTAALMHTFQHVIMHRKEDGLTK
jgi:hypothetical protein